MHGSVHGSVHEDVRAARRLASLALLLALPACAPEPAPPPSRLALRGPLAARIDRAPTSLDACTPRDSAGVRSHECDEALPDGRQRLVVAADSTVTEVAREWLLGDAAREPAFARESTALARAFGVPAHARRLDAASRARDGRAAWRSECLAWRGADGVEAVLRLDPLVDVGPVRDTIDWRLSRRVRQGAIPPAIACGLREGAP